MKETQAQTQAHDDIFSYGLIIVNTDSLNRL